MSVFFFSSRRRHTRFDCDWSSDVCSSDLFEQVKTNDERSFREHLILNKGPTPNEYGVSFTQLHSLDLVDVDGDGLKDIVTGKRFWAHGHKGPDPESDNPAVLYWFKLTRSSK